MTTNFVTAKYQEIYDIQTVSDKVSIIAIHTPVGQKPRQMLAGYFTQFRKFKYNGCSVVGTPAQRLGLSTPQLSTAAGNAMVNPKDVFNPALVRGCHGDNLNNALNSIYKGSFQNEGSAIGADQFDTTVVPADGLSWEQMYYRMLQDPSFKKFSLNNGIKLKGLHPMVYNVASNHQMTDVINTAGTGRVEVGGMEAADSKVHFNSVTDGNVSSGAGGSADPIFPRFMTNRLQSLGWLDTKQVLNGFQTGGYTSLPKIFMAVIVLPPALSENVRTSMRFVVTHHWAFKEFNTSLSLLGASEYYDWLISTSSTGAKANDTFETNGLKDSIELVNDAVY